MGYLLTASGVSKYYGTHQALRDISINVPEGSIFGLLGPNGAGKTTLIRILTQITAPDRGEVLFKGRPLGELSSAKMGYLPEERGLYRKMKVGEQAIYLMQLKGLSRHQAIHNLKYWFQRLKMEAWWNKRVDALSKGMQQRFQFVVTVAHDPDLLILDEPFSGFDPVNAEELKKEIIRLREKGTSIILSTHNMGSVEELCENICLIHNGQAVLNGSIAEAKKTYSKSLFKLRFRGSNVAFANALGHRFEIVSLTEHGHEWAALVKSHEDSTSNQLLEVILQTVDVIAFEEQLPSMNDIFIDLVTKTTLEPSAA